MPAIILWIGCVHSLQELQLIDFIALTSDDVAQPNASLLNPDAFTTQLLQDPITFGR
jgi:hypothetical protein